MKDIVDVKVNEQFLSVQGEGPSQGRLAWFYRLNRCNLRCKFCDSAYTWEDAKVEQAVVPVQASSVNLVVITGGEPMLPVNREYTFKLLQEIGKYWPVTATNIEIETNGIFSPFDAKIKNLTYIVSPKFRDSGKRLNIGLYKMSLKKYVALGDRAAFKFVVNSLKDIEFIKSLVKELNISNNRIWIMPQGTFAESLIRTSQLIISKVIENGWNYSARLQRFLEIS